VSGDGGDGAAAAGELTDAESPADDKAEVGDNGVDDEEEDEDEEGEEEDEEEEETPRGVIAV